MKPRQALETDALRAMYSLSRAEAARALGLCEGPTLKEMAFDRGVSLNTVRSQLESVQRKIGANPQVGHRFHRSH